MLFTSSGHRGVGWLDGDGVMFDGCGGVGWRWGAMAGWGVGVGYFGMFKFLVVKEEKGGAVSNSL